MSQQNETSTHQRRYRRVATKIAVRTTIQSVCPAKTGVVIATTSKSAKKRTLARNDRNAKMNPLNSVMKNAAAAIQAMRLRSTMSSRISLLPPKD